METFNVQIIDLSSSLHPLLQTLQHPSIQTNLQAIKPSSTVDVVAILILLLSSFGYITRGQLWDKPDPYYGVWYERPQQQDGSSKAQSQASHNIAQRLEDEDYKCVILWGSQSGTSERFAETIGRECFSHFGIRALVADISDYDIESIASISKACFAILILSTYGEGDPSNNTAGLWDWIKKIKDDGTKLANLHYVAFGLGNSNYKYYNRVVDVVADTIDEAGATALIPRQKADDANGGTEEDFQSWKDDLFAMFREMGYDENAVAYQPTVDVEFVNSTEAINSTISAHHQTTGTSSAIVPLPIKSVRELFTAGDRNCVHLELDLGREEIGYKTGDHIGVWPCNPEGEIKSLLSALGLQERSDEVVTVEVFDTSAKSKVPSPTSLKTAFRNHLDICGSVSRKTFLELSQFAPSSGARAILVEYGQNKEKYAQLMTNTHITFARLLHLASPDQPWNSLPLAFVFENLLPLQPRYYSISSSSVISPRRIAITALVVNTKLSTTSIIYGLASNYLLSASKLPTKSAVPAPSLSFQHTSPTSPEGPKIYAHIRKSKFKLPITSSTPLILISAGTGFAPFRAFLAERTKIHILGKPVGKILLFFGCRSASGDYIYADEIAKFQDSLGEKLEVVTAFSRDEGRKVYVQDRVEERVGEVLASLDEGASLYVCGKAAMASEVDARIETAKVRRGMGEEEVRAWVEGLKKRGKWRADVWG